MQSRGSRLSDEKLRNYLRGRLVEEEENVGRAREKVRSSQTGIEQCDALDEKEEAQARADRVQEKLDNAFSD